MKFLYILYFLILSCDLPGEADADCNGDQNGLAVIDDCGICSGGDTGYEINSDKDLCGECFGGNSCYEPQCSDELAINYYENAENVDDSLCMYDLCTDYLSNNDNFNCESTGNSPYLNHGDLLSCETLNYEFDLCYPDDCDETVKLADFEDKVIFIIYEEDW